MSKSMKVAYVAGPYLGKTHWETLINIQRAELLAAKLWKLGFAVICPHKNSAWFSGLGDEEMFYAGDIEILKRCDLVVLTDMWVYSPGTREEVHAAAEEALIPIVEGSDDDELMRQAVAVTIGDASMKVLKKLDDYEAAHKVPTR